MTHLRIDDRHIGCLATCAATDESHYASHPYLPGDFADALGNIARDGASAELRMDGAGSQSAAAGSNAEAGSAAVDVLICGAATIVPLDEAEDNDEQLFGHCFHFSDDEPRVVFSNELPTLHARLLFGLRCSNYEALRQWADGAELRLYSSLTSLLKHHSVTFGETSRQRLCVNCRDRFVDVFAFDDTRLTLFNSYSVSGVTDIVYYVIAVANTVGINLSSVRCYVMGDRVTAENAISHLRRFIQKVSPVALPDDCASRAATSTSAIPYDLVLHTLCAS